MYRPFTAQKGSWIFIEEPELSLHPGLQHIFLHALSRHEAIIEKNLCAFMTTHSGHMLGMLGNEITNMASISFQPTETPERFLVRHILDRDHSPMNLPGVVNSSVYLANCAIWVEGITDRPYLRSYLKAYQESSGFQKDLYEGRKRLMREDIHYAFLEYAGSNLEHYYFPRPKVEPLIEDEEGNLHSVPEKTHALAVCNRICAG